MNDKLIDVIEATEAIIVMDAPTLYPSVPIVRIRGTREYFVSLRRKGKPPFRATFSEKAARGAGFFKEK